MRILVTGGAGFIGSTTGELLMSLGHDVVVLDSLVTGSRANVPSKATFVQGDCGDTQLIHSLGAIDACIHFAGLIEPRASMEHPEKFFANNVGSSLRLFEALVDVGVSKVVFSSSCAVYGDQVAMPISEDRPIAPVSPYGLSKRMVEETLEWLTKLGRLRAASLRYFNAAGATMSHPEAHQPEGHLIPLALDVAAGRRDHLDVYGTDYSTPDGTCVRDYIHVSDLATAHVAAIDALDHFDELTINLGSEIGSSNRDVINAVERVTGVILDVRYGARRAGDPAAAVASSARARDVLGWRPERSDLDTVVSDAWAAHRRLS